MLLMMSASLGTPVVVRGYERAGLVVQLESRIDLEIAATSAQVQFAGLTSARGGDSLKRRVTNQALSS